MRLSQLAISILLLSSVACKKSTDTTTAPPTGGGTGTGVGNTQPFTGTSNKLVVSTALNLSTSWIELGEDTVFTQIPVSTGLFKNMPTGFDNKILSLFLPKGYMAVFAVNEDGSGESSTFVAIDSAVRVNLPTRLRNNISYIRYIKINNPNKKGTCSVTETTVTALASEWYYGWSLDKNSFTNQQYVPMTWGRTSATDLNVLNLINRKDIDHLLSFNEPDNTAQANISVDTAIARYRVMLRTGLRLGSPACKEENTFGTGGKWLPTFMAQAQTLRMRVDHIAIHWYDWGNFSNNQATDSLTAERVFQRFQSFIQNTRSAYPNMPIWITEYNANVNRSSITVQKYFMKLSSEWLNTLPYIERYSFFFEHNYPAVTTPGVLSELGAYWKSLPSTKSFSGNIFGDAILIR
jgi:hypothetical protein